MIRLLKNKKRLNIVLQSFIISLFLVPFALTEGSYNLGAKLNTEMIYYYMIIIKVYL